MLKHNLVIEKRVGDFDNLYAKSILIYNSVVCILVVIGSFLFDMYHDLPMILCLGISIGLVVMSFFLRDEDEHFIKHNYNPDFDSYAVNPDVFVKKKHKRKHHNVSTFLFLILLLSFLARGTFHAGVELPLHILNDLPITTALSMICVFFARLMRTVGSYYYTSVKHILKKYLAFVIAISYIVSLYITFIAGTVPMILELQVILIGVAYSIMLIGYDYMKMYMVGMMVLRYNGKKLNTMLSFLDLTYRVGNVAIFSLTGLLLGIVSPTAVTLVYACLCFIVLCICVWMIIIEKGERQKIRQKKIAKLLKARLEEQD